MALTRPRAYQIYDIDYKQAVRVISLSNVTLAGGAPNALDGVNLSLNDRILVAGQTNGAQNGIYYVTTLGTGSNGTWTRSVDTDATGELLSGTIVMVTEGTTYADTQWKLTTNDPITIGVTSLTFVQNYLANSISYGGTSFAVGSSNANAVISVSAVSNVVVVAPTNATFAANILPNANVTYNLGSTSQRWKDIWLSNSTIYLGNITLGATATQLTVGGANVVTSDSSGNVSTTGNITGGNIFTTGIASVTGTISVAGNVNSTAIAIGNGAVNNVAVGFFPTAGTAAAMAIRDYSTVASTIYFDVGMGGATAGTFSFRTTNSYSTVMVANTAGITTPGRVYGLELNSTQSSGDEGGQINLSLPATNTTLAGPVVIDVYQNRLRFFEGGGTARGAYIDLASCNAGVATNLLSGGGGGGTPGGSNTNVQFNDLGSFGGNGQFTYDKVTNTLTAGIVSANNNGAGTNFKVGDDAWIGDINTADTIGIKGQQNPANAYIVFGNSDATGKLGRAGTGPLTYAGAFSATGNITGGNLIQGTSRVIKWTTANGTPPTNAVPGDEWYDSSTDKLYLYINDGTSNVWVDQSQTTSFSTLAVTGAVTIGSTLGVTGNITGGNLTVSTGTITFGSATNAGANGSGNIGSSTGYFNTIFAKATSAQYADIAEKYSSDQPYDPGTVVVFGGKEEVTLAINANDDCVAGVVSTKPAYIMNAGINARYSVDVALTGRVPTKVIGPVKKGNMMVSAGNGYAQACAAPRIGTVIGKAIENFDGEQGIIEIVVGRI